MKAEMNAELQDKLLGTFDCLIVGTSLARPNGRVAKAIIEPLPGIPVIMRPVANRPSIPFHIWEIIQISPSPSRRKNEYLSFYYT